MAIKSIISSGTKTEKFSGALLKVGAANTLKLNREALNKIGIGPDGGYVYVAEGDESTEFYVAASENAVSASGAKGSKLAISGEKKETTMAAANQLQFTHAELGKRMYDEVAVFQVNDETVELDGLTFYSTSVLQTREEASPKKDEAAPAAENTPETPVEETASEEAGRKRKSE